MRDRILWTPVGSVLTDNTLASLELSGGPSGRRPNTPGCNAVPHVQPVWLPRSQEIHLGSGHSSSSVNSGLLVIDQRPGKSKQFPRCGLELSRFAADAFACCGANSRGDLS